MAQMLSPFTVSRMPPQNIEAEISLLGSVLLDGGVIDRVVDVVNGVDFYKKEHQAIFDAAVALFQKQKPIDVLTVGVQLKEQGRFDEVGGSGYLTTLVNSVPTASNAVYYAEIIRKKKILRDLISVSHEISRMRSAEHTSELQSPSNLIY